MKNEQIFREFKTIPTQLTEEQFNLFVLPHLSEGSRGPHSKLPFYKIFNYILRLIHTGVQWYCLPIENDFNGKPEISFTRVYRIFRRWIKDGSLQKVFESSVIFLAEKKLLDTAILHGDGTTTAAKKGGDVMGYSGHKHQRGEKIVAITDRNANIIAPFVVAAANKNECNLYINTQICFLLFLDESFQNSFTS